MGLRQGPPWKFFIRWSRLGCAVGVGLGVSRAGRPDGSQTGAALEIFYSLVKAWVCCRGRPGSSKGGAPRWLSGMALP